MSDDISQSVSQRGRGEEIAENRRIYEVSDELLRRSQLYEAQLRDGQEHISRFEAEQRVAEQYAKENGYGFQWMRSLTWVCQAQVAMRMTPMFPTTSFIK